MPNRVIDKTALTTVGDLHGFFTDSTADGVRPIFHSVLKHIYNGECPDVTAGNGTDYASAIQTYLTAGRRVNLPRGTTRFDSTLTFPAATGGYLTGAGINRTFLDATQAGAFSFTNDALLSAAGSYNQLVNLGSSVNRGEKELPFASAPNCAEGDLLFIYNSTDSSFSNWRTNYRAGEFVKVAGVSGNVVTIQGILEDSYVYTAVEVYKVTPTPLTIKDLTILCPNTANMAGLLVDLAERVRLENVAIIGASYASIAIRRSFDFELRGCVAHENFNLDAGGTDYGLIVSNSQNGSVSGGQFVASRHAITNGGGDLVGSVPCTSIRYSGLYAATSGTTSFALDTHGNCRDVSFDQVETHGGVSFGGSRSSLTNSKVFASVDQASGETPVYYTELRDTSHTLNNVKLFSSSDDTARGQFIDVAGNDVTTLGASTNDGGTFKWSNLRFYYEGSTEGGEAIKIHDRGYAGSRPINAVCENITSICEDQTLRRGPILDLLVSSGSTNFGDLVIQNVKHQGSGPSTDGEGSTVSRIGRVVHTGNYYYRGSGRGVSLLSIAGRCRSAGNTYIDQVFHSQITGEASEATHTAEIHIGQELFLDGYRNGNNTGSQSGGILLAYADLVSVRDMDFFNANQKMVVGDSSQFSVNDTLTGANSTHTATVLAKDDSSNTVFIGTTATGSFQAAETITNGTGGSTTVTSIAEVAHESTAYFLDVATVRRRGIVCNDARAVSVNSVTSDNQD